MTFFATAHSNAPGMRGHRRSFMMPIALGLLLTAGAIILIVYLLWPTWTPDPSGDAPAQLPVSIGGTLFNLPSAAIRIKVERRAGPQEGIELSFAFPSLEPPTDAPKPVSADTLQQALQPIDRIFLSISAHHDMLAPEVRLHAIYPRYLEQDSIPGQDGLTMRAFRDGTPYSHEDLFMADTPKLTARCTRDTASPGMCLSERRIDGADLTFRFPRSWLARWRDVADAMERLTMQLLGPKR